MLVSSECLYHFLERPSLDPVTGKACEMRSDGGETGLGDWSFTHALSCAVSLFFR